MATFAATVLQEAGVYFEANTKWILLRFCIFFLVYTENNIVTSGYLYSESKN